MVSEYIKSDWMMMMMTIKEIHESSAAEAVKDRKRDNSADFEIQVVNLPIPIF